MHSTKLAIKAVSAQFRNPSPDSGASMMLVNCGPVPACIGPRGKRARIALLTSFWAFAREVRDSCAPQGEDAYAWMVQGPILVRHDTLPWLVSVQQDMVGLLIGPKYLCVPCKALQQGPQPPASFYS